MRELGLKLGVSSSSVVWDFPPCPPRTSRVGICIEKATPHRRRTSPAAGLWARWGFGLSWLTLQTELLYLRKGYEVTGPRYHMDYLEAPLLVRVDVPPKRAFGAFLIGGVAPALRVTCSVAYTSGGPAGRVTRVWGCDETTRLGETYPIRSWDLGLVFGGGVRGRLGSRRVFVEFRGTLGQIDIEPESGFAPLTLNNSYAVWLGYSLTRLGAGRNPDGLELR